MNLIGRELRTWCRSIGLWWALPPFLIIVECAPAKMIYLYNINVQGIEEAWVFLTKMFSGFLEQNPFLAAGMGMTQAGQGAKELASLSPEALWRIHFIPFLQLWGAVVLPLIVPPMAIGAFNRDREQGIFQYACMTGVHPFKLLMAKQLVMLLQLAWMQGLAYVSFLLMFQFATKRPELFAIGDSLWLSSWMGASLALSMVSISASWLTCLVTRNTQSEIYNGLLVSSVIFMGALQLFSQSGWNHALFTRLVGGCLVSVLILNILIARAIRREKFFIH